MSREHGGLRLVPPLTAEREAAVAAARSRLREIEAERGDQFYLFVEDHELAAALFTDRDIVRAVARLEELLAGRDEPRKCNCGESS